MRRIAIATQHHICARDAIFNTFPALNASHKSIAGVGRRTNTLVNNHSTLMAAKRAGISFTYSAGHSMDVSSTDKSMIPAAVATAKAADVAVVMVGLCADHCAGKGRTENEGNDRGPGGQEDLLEAVVAAQPKTILVMINGGMMSISWAKDHVPAILEAYYPGQLGGDAIVNTLFGDNNPGALATFGPVGLRRRLSEMACGQ
eukprot:COSAG04_NODE_8349_length_987_cov_1.248874_2_plen_201_part_01